MEDSHKAFGFWRGWALAVGCAIGSGIFMMPTLLAPYGMLGQAGWLTAGGGAILIALLLSRMSKRVTKSGGPYAYAHAGLGKFAGFLVAWTYWISCVAAVAGISVAFVGYLGYFFPSLAGDNITNLILTLVLVWSIVLLNIRSIEGSGSFLLVTTVLKILPLLLIAVFGLANADPQNLPAYNPTDLHPIALLATVTMLVQWSFLGIETATVPSGNMVDPEKNIPRIMIASVLTILVVYLLVSLAISYTVPASELMGSEAPFTLAAERLLGPIGGAIIAIGAMISTLGSLNANCFTAGQMPFVAARDNLFPARFAKLNKAGAPVASFMLCGGVSSILLMMNFTKGLVGAFTFMILLSTLSTLIAYTFSNVAEFYFLKDEDRGPAFTRTLILSLCTFAYTLFAIWGAGQEVVFYSFFLILIGMPLYALVREE